MNKIRYGLQGIFITLMAYIGYRHQVVGGGPLGTPPLDAYCPFGAVETLAALLFSSQFLPKTASSNFWILGALFMITLFVGAVFCGWICPLGGLSDWLYAIRRRFIHRKIEVPERLGRILSYGRYAMLLMILFMSWRLGKLWFEEYDPFKLIFHFDVETTTAWVVIVSFVLGSMLLERMWCRYLCPLGGLVGIFNRFSFFRIERSAASCVHCHKCERICPVGISVEQQEQVRDTRCVSCLQCVDSCPVQNTLTVKPAFGFLPALKPVTTGLVGLLMFAGVIAGVQATGLWNAKSPSIRPASQISSPAEIKGWMKWSEVVDQFKVDEKALAEQLKLPTGFDRGKTVKALGKEHGFAEETLRQTIQKLKNK